MKKIYKYLSLVGVIILGYFIFRTPEIKQPPGVLAPNSPEQKKIEKTDWEYENFNFRAVASFSLVARVLSIKFYGSDDMSDFCPVDIAVGWNKMSDQAIVDKIEIKQQHRWYVWRTDNFPIPRNEIEMSSSNIHIIPSNENVEDVLDDVIKGNIILLKGKLVNVNKIGNDFTWKTSLNRKDTGGGACEILWVEELEIIR